MKTVVRLFLAMLVPVFLFFSCSGSAGVGPGSTPKAEYSIAVQLNDTPNGKVVILDQRVRVPEGTTITLYIEAEEGYSLDTLKYYAGDKTGDLFDLFERNPESETETGTVSFKMPAGDTTIEGTFEHSARKITITSNGGGAIGTIPPRTARYTDDVVVNVVPSPSYRIAKSKPETPPPVMYSYYDSDSNEHVIPFVTEPFGFSMPDADVNINVNFERIYTVHINNEDESIGTIAISDDSHDQINKFAEDDWVFITTDVTNDWYAINDIIVKSSYYPDKDITDSRKFQMPIGDVTVSVTYRLNPSNLYQIDVAPLVNGTITPTLSQSGGSSSYQVRADMPVYLDIQPKPGYEIDPETLYYNDGSDHSITVPSSGRPSFMMPSYAITIRGQFRLRQMDVTASVSNGNVSFGGQTKTTSLMGQTVNFSVTPNANYRLKEGSLKYTYNNTEGTPILVSPGNYRFTMPAYDTVIIAVFERLYNVDVKNNLPASSTGSVIITNETQKQTFPANTDPTFTITNAGAVGDTISVAAAINSANDWYVLGGITVSPGAGYNSDTDSFVMPIGPATVTINYVLNPENEYAINMVNQPGAHGTIEARSSANGSLVLLKAKAGTPVYIASTSLDTGYKMATAKYNDGVDKTISILGSERPSFSMPAHDVAVSATFTKIDYGLSAPGLTNGTIKFLPGNQSTPTAQYQDIVKFTISSNSGYRLDIDKVRYSYNGTDYTPDYNPATSEFSFSMPASAVTIKAVFNQLYNVKVINDGVTGKVSSKGTVVITNDDGIPSDYFIAGEKVNVDVQATDGNFVVNKITRNNPSGEVSGGYFNIPNPMSYSDITVTVTYTQSASYQWPITRGSLSNGTIRFYNGDDAIISAAALESIVYLDIQPNTGYMLKPGSITVKGNNSGGNITVTSSSPRPSFEMPFEGVTVSCEFINIDYNVTVKSSGVSNGTIKFLPGDLTKTTAWYKGTVKFTVSADPGFRLIEGSVKYAYNESSYIYDPSFANGEYSIVSMPNYDVTVTAEFEKLYNVSVTNNLPLGATGSVVVVNESQKQNFPANTETAFTITNAGGAGDTISVAATISIANNWYVLDKITASPGAGFNSDTDSFVMPADNANVSISYVLNPDNEYAITINQPATGGTLGARSSPTGNIQLTKAKKGTTVYIATPTVSTGYALDSLSYNDGVKNNVIEITPPDRPSFQMPEHEVTVSGTFEKINYNVSVDSSVSGGIIEFLPGNLNNTQAKYEDTVKFTVSENSGFRLDTDSVRYAANSIPDFNSALSEYSFSMPASDTKVRAVFNKLYKVDLDSGTDTSKGKISFINDSGAETDEFIEGEQVIVKFTKTSYYMVNSIKVDGVEIINAMKFTMPADKVKVEATFYLPVFDINLSWTGSGYIDATVNGQVKYQGNEGDNVVLTISPGTGYKYDKITINSTYSVNTVGNTTVVSFTMPDSSISAKIDFVKKTFTVQREEEFVENGSISFLYPSNPAGGTVVYNDKVIIKPTIELGYRVNSMTYYLQGQDPSSGVVISNTGAGTNYEFSVPNFPDYSVILIHVEFTPAPFDLASSSSITSHGKIVFKDENNPSTPIFSAQYGDMVIADLTIDDGYYYTPGSFKINGSVPTDFLETPGPGQSTIQVKFRMPPAKATASATLSVNKYNLVLDNPQPQYGTSSISAVTANHGTTVTITMTPATGCVPFMIKFVSPNAQLEYNIVLPASNNKYTIELSNFTGTPLHNDTFQVTTTFIPSNNLLSYVTNPDIGISLYLGTNLISQNSFVPKGSVVTVKISNTADYRYSPGSLKINNVVPSDLPSGFISSYSFVMPPTNAQISVSSEPIPYANISFEDPNMDKNIYFYGNLVEDPGNIYRYQLVEALSNQTVEIRVQKLLYVDNGTEVFENIPNAVVKAWWLNGNVVASNVSSYTIPPGSSGKTLGVLVEIGGIPHSKSIKIQ